MARSTRQWRSVAVAALVLGGALGVAGEAQALPQVASPLQAGSEALAQVAPADDGAVEPDTQPTASGGTIESVTVTETRLRRVVVGLIAVAVVTAGLTLAYARHTSPRRRARLAAEREEARVRRLAAAAAVGDVESRPPAVDPEAEPVSEPLPEPVPVRARRPRPDPRPQARRSG